jgi:DNA modification methylase
MRRNGYADVPVVKSKAEYSRARWQFDADSHWRSSGNRLLAPEDLVGLEAADCFQRFKRFSESTVYDHEHNVAIAEARDRAGQLPPSFKLLQLQSHSPDVWADLVRMRTLNTTQYSKGKEQHVCPFPIDLAERLIARFSAAGELVLDPFGGLGTTALCAVEMDRRGYTIELNAQYHADAVHYLRAAEAKRDVPTLFDLMDGAA